MRRRRLHFNEVYVPPSDDFSANYSKSLNILRTSQMAIILVTRSKRVYHLRNSERLQLITSIRIIRIITIR